MGFSAKTFSIKTKNNWGNDTYTGIRSFEFIGVDGNVIPLTSSDFTTYATSTYSGDYSAANIFDTACSKTGTNSGNAWVTAQISEQIISVVFNTEIDFIGIVVNNALRKLSGLDTTRGVKDVELYISDDTVTSAVIPENNTKIFDGQIAEHIFAEVIDDQTLTLLGAVAISGTVTDGVNPLARTVNLYHRATGDLIKTTTSNASTGAFTFEYLLDELYYVVVLDDDAGESFNAIIFDKIIPVEMI